MTFECLKKELHEKLRRRMWIANLIGAILILLSEIVIALFFYRDNFILDLPEYICLRILIPSGMSFSAILISSIIIKSNKFSEFVKNFVAVGSIFILCSVVSVFHNYYTLLLVAVIVPFFMCSAFGSKKILNIISIATIPITVVSFVISYNERFINTDVLYRVTTFLCCIVFIIVSYVCANVLLNILQVQMDYLSFSNKNERDLIERLQLDPLTELNNRTRLKEILAEALKNFTFSNEKYYLVMIDVDRFKSINDTYGHLKGDIVLKRLAHIIKNHLLEGDYGFRFGGEEFLVLLKAKTGEELDSVYEEVRRIGEEFSSSEYDFCAGTMITFSAGICSCENIHESDDWIKGADEAMYTSKIEGRNRITVYNKKV